MLHEEFNPNLQTGTPSVSSRIVLAFSLLVAVVLATARAGFGKEPAKIPPKEPVATPQALREALLARTTLTVDKQPLRDVLKLLADQQGVKIRVDEEAVQKAGISLEQAVTISAKNYTLTAVLRMLLQRKGLGYGIEGDSILVTVAASVPRPMPVLQRPEPAGAAPNVNGEVLAELEAQRGEAYRSLLRLELQFIEKVCRPDAEQMAKIREDGEVALKVISQQTSRRLLRQNGRESPLLTPDLIIQMRRHFLAAARSRLSPDQLAPLATELEARQNDLKQAALRLLVTRIDEAVVLEPQQREALLKGLAQSHSGWFPAIDSGWIPEPGAEIPSSALRPFLSEAQVQLWQVTSRASLEKHLWTNGTWFNLSEEELRVGAPPVEERPIEKQPAEKRVEKRPDEKAAVAKPPPDPGAAP